jgi:hypothetical protein
MIKLIIGPKNSFEIFRGWRFITMPVNGAIKKPKNCIRPKISEYLSTTGKKLHRKIKIFRQASTLSG